MTDDGQAAQIVVCPFGPLLVRGPVEIVDAEGNAVERRRQTVALCRCGASKIKPYCDGTHKRIPFGKRKGSDPAS